jgi:hypothetical protein
MVRAGFERLHAFLTAPARLTEDPVFQRLRANRDRARAMHAPTRKNTKPPLKPTSANACAAHPLPMSNRRAGGIVPMSDNNERNAEIIRLRRTGMGPREIARHLECSPNAVAGVLNRAGLCLPGPNAGEASGNAKLTEDRVIELRAMHRRGVHGFGYKALGRRFGIHSSAAMKIILRQTWKHVA